MTEVFHWNGEPIADIEAWARENGEMLVEYEERERNPWTGAWEKCWTGAMPVSFWDARRESGDRILVETGRRGPR